MPDRAALPVNCVARHVSHLALIPQLNLMQSQLRRSMQATIKIEVTRLSSLPETLEPRALLRLRYMHRRDRCTRSLPDPRASTCARPTGEEVGLTGLRSAGYFGSQSEPVRVVQGTKVAMSRFMMHRPGAPRPLSFDPREKTGPVLASASTRWAGIPLEIHDVPSFDAPLDTSPMKGARGMILALDGVRTLFVRQGRSERQLMAKPGLIGFAEGGQSAGVVRSVGQSRVLVMDVPAIWQERLLLDGGPESFVELPVIPAHETAQALGLAMYSEVKSGASSGAMFAESLSIALLSYVAERIPARSMRVRGSLSDAQRRRLARYIDEHLQEDLKLTDIAKLVGLQPRHFSTLFRKAFGITPHQYLIERRIEHGARLLAGSAADIATIALHVGFSSQSHFATAFRKRYGMSPRRYAISRRSSFAGS